MSVQKRGKNSYRIEVRTGRDPVTGKYTKIRETFRGTARDARQREEELNVQHRAGTAVTASRETVAEYLERWVTHRQAINKVRPRTAEVYRGYIAREVNSSIGQVRLTDVRPMHIQSVVDEALASGLSARTVRQVFAIMRAAFRQALKWQLIAVSPCDAVTPPQAEAPKLVTPSPADVARLLELINERFTVPLALAAGTGARRGEILALRWAQVDLDGDRGQIHVGGTLQRVDGTLIVLGTKSTRSRRVLPLSASLTTALRAVRTEQLERRMLLGPAWTDGDFVFDAGDGAPIDPDAFTRSFRAARKTAGLDRVRLHDVRHLFASMLVTNGTNISVVSDLLGHATAGFTMSTYVHGDAAAAVAAIDDAERLLGGEAR